VPDDDGAGGDSASASGSTIGPYRVVREIGRGGMGVVYEAEQKSPRRPVRAQGDPGGRHVDAEASAFSGARRQPGASQASVHRRDLRVGLHREGQHFFAMELVQGRSLSEYLGRARPRAIALRRSPPSRPVPENLRRCGLCPPARRHPSRLKPSNILVLEARGEVPEIKVLDFGLARITDPDAQGATAVTAFGRVQGTLPYMSPEQVRGRRDEVERCAPMSTPLASSCTAC